MSEILRIARDLAARRPEATLACPVCAAALKAANLERHLGKLHPNAAPATSWAGTGPRGGRLRVDSDGFRLRGRGGLRRRRVAAPHRVAVGSVVKRRVDVVMASYADEMNVPTTESRAGAYLDIEGVDGAIVVRCRTTGPLRKIWTGWVPGQPKRRWDITLTAGDFVSLQYALAARGLLRPRSGPARS